MLKQAKFLQLEKNARLILTDSGGAASANDDLPANTSIGVILVGGTTVTEITVSLYGSVITATT